MYRTILAILCLAAFGAGVAFAQDEKPPAGIPDKESASPALEHVIYVPYKELSKVFEKEGRGVFISYKEFRKIWEKATAQKIAKPLPPVPAVVTKAAYNLTVEKDVAQGKGVLSIEVLTDEWISVPLNLKKLALREAKLDDGRALLVSTEKSYTLVLRGKGEHKLDISFAVPVDRSEGGGKMEFGCPSAPVSELTVEIPETDLDIDVQPKLVASVKPEEGKTTVLAFVGSTGSVAVSWKPKPREALPLAGVFFSSVVNAIHAGDGVLKLTSEINYEILQELNRLQVELPSGMRLLGVEGAQIKVWSVAEEDGRRILTVDLLSQAKKSYKLTVLMDKELASGEQEMELPRVRVIGATRETGFVSFSVGEELWGKLGETKGASQVGAAELPSPVKPAPLFAFRYLAHPYSVKVRVGDVVPEIHVDTYTQFTITKEFLDLASHFSVDIRKRPVFSLSANIPAGYAVIDVPNRMVKDYRVKEKDGRQIIEMDFERPAKGAVELQVYLQKKRDGKDEVELPYTAISEAKKESGVFGIHVASQLRLSTLEQSGLVPADGGATTPGGRKLRREPNTEFAMAFRYHMLPVSAKLKVEQRKTRIDATVETLVTVREEIVKVHSDVRYNVKYAPVRVFQLAMPKSVGEDARVRGANTSSVTKETSGQVTTWTVQLQGDTLGDYTLEVDCDVKAKFDKDTVTEIPLAELTLMNVFQETGYIAIKKTENLRVAAKTVSGLELVDVQELPKALANSLPYEAYKYVSHPYELTLSIQKQELADVLDSIINLMHLETEISRDGEATNKCIWKVQSKNRQYINFVLPEGSEVMKLYVDGKETRRTITKGPNYLAVNLSEGGTSSEDVLIEVVYKQKLHEEAGSLGLTGAFALTAPVPEEEIPTLRTTWVLHVPRGYFYTAFGGNLRRLFRHESVWIWGKSILFGTPSERGGDNGILNDINNYRQLFVKDPKLIKFEFSGDSLEYYFVKQEGRGEISFRYFERNFFFALDVLILLAAAAAMLAGVSYLPHVTKLRASVVVISVSLVLRTLLSGAGGEFFATIFLAAILVSAYWIVRFFALPPARRLAAAGKPVHEEPETDSEGGGEDA